MKRQLLAASVVSIALWAGVTATAQSQEALVALDRYLETWNSRDPAVWATSSRLGRDGRVLSTDEGVFLVVLRDGTWRLQARSTMGT